ncbi:hypothetical protein DAI22_11g140600 [Oryza sativa Japonica Group]|nr:hypothetical protein DAI22_11g140600 [Oryza sativa Japonica Group]
MLPNFQHTNICCFPHLVTNHISRSFFFSLSPGISDLSERVTDEIKLVAGHGSNSVTAAGDQHVHRRGCPVVLSVLEGDGRCSPSVWLRPPVDGRRARRRRTTPTALEAMSSRLQRGGGRIWRTRSLIRGGGPEAGHWMNRQGGPWC